MKAIIWLGGLFMLIGILGLAIPRFTTSQTTDLASIGDIKVQNTVISHHIVAPTFDYRRAYPGRGPDWGRHVRKANRISDPAAGAVQPNS